jgi:hypothetical protein
LRLFVLDKALRWSRCKGSMVGSEALLGATFILFSSFVLLARLTCSDCGNDSL